MTDILEYWIDAEDLDEFNANFVGPIEVWPSSAPSPRDGRPASGPDDGQDDPMSVKVELERLLEVAAGFRTVPLLLTTDDDQRPRAAAVTVEWEGEVATVRAGHRSVANAAQRPLVSLLWPAPPDERFALLVDGTVEGTAPDPSEEGAKAGGRVSVRATHAILHVVGRPHRSRPQGGESGQSGRRPAAATDPDGAPSAAGSA